MDIAIRILLYVTIGFILLTANYWFVRSVQRSLFANEFVIAPFEVIRQSATNDQYGHTRPPGNSPS